MQETKCGRPKKASRQGTKMIALQAAIVMLRSVSANAAPPVILSDSAQSLINHKVAYLDGWAWESYGEDPPNFHSDSDIGASGIGISFLHMYNATKNAAYLNAAEEAGDWLISTQTSTGWWPDYFNPDNTVANYGFTSLDDGAVGQAIFLWKLYEKTGNTAYEVAAVKGANWVVSYADAPSGESCPAQECYWHWFVPTAGNGAEIYLGAGEGIAGIMYGLDKLSQLTGNVTYEQYALAAGAYEERNISSSGAVPETPGGKVSATGLYQGGAGIAVAFYALYQHTGGTRWLTDANKIMTWVRSKKVAESNGAAWPNEVGSGGDNGKYPSIAFGNAGIGWSELQAYKITSSPVDLQTAEAAGNWLLSTAKPLSGGYAWQEPYGNQDYYTARDEGAAGIGYFLYDLYLVTETTSYNAAAQHAAKWLQASAFLDAAGPYWGTDNCIGCGGWEGKYEPSINWGSAGIGSFGARLGGGPDDMPRDMDALP